MAMRIDPRIHNNFLDANFWDESGNPSQDRAILDILDLAEQEEIDLILPFSVKAELEHPNTPQEIKRKASDMIYTLATALTSNELKIRAKLLALIQGNAKLGEHNRDVLHLFEAHKYGGGYFITKDRRMLKRRTEIQLLLTSLQVVSPSKFMAAFRSDGCQRPRSRPTPTLRHYDPPRQRGRTLSGISYKGYVIRPAPLRLADGHWNHEVYVALDRGYELVERKFFSAATFSTREEAVAHCIVFGKQIIDGAASNCSIDDL